MATVSVDDLQKIAIAIEIANYLRLRRKTPYLKSSATGGKVPVRCENLALASKIFQAVGDHSPEDAGPRLWAILHEELVSEARQSRIPLIPAPLSLASNRENNDQRELATTNTTKDLTTTNVEEICRPPVRNAIAKVCARARYKTAAARWAINQYIQRILAGENIQDMVPEIERIQKDFKSFERKIELLEELRLDTYGGGGGGGISSNPSLCHQGDDTTLDRSGQVIRRNNARGRVASVGDDDEDEEEGTIVMKIRDEFVTITRWSDSYRKTAVMRPRLDWKPSDNGSDVRSTDSLLALYT